MLIKNPNNGTNSISLVLILPRLALPGATETGMAVRALRNKAGDGVKSCDDRRGTSEIKGAVAGYVAKRCE